MLIGLLILIFGIVLLFEELIPGFSIDFSTFWPLLFIVLGFINILRDKKLSIVSSIFVIVGTIFLLINLNILDEYFYGIVYPVILIIVGGGIVASNTVKNNKSKISTKIVNNKSYKVRNYSGIFGGVEQSINEKDFEGANIYSIFGGVELDLSEIQIEENIIIYVYSIFGGTDLHLPEKYNVIITDTSIFGSTDNKIKRIFNDKEKTIYINITNIFGGTDLK